MSIFFSPSTRGFYTSAIHGDAVPADVVRISAARHRELLAAQAAGAAIVIERGRPEIRRPRNTATSRRRSAVELVKREARRRILEIAPTWRQVNDNAAIALAAYQLGATCTTDVGVELALERRRAIDAVRAASGRLEVAIATMPAAELEAFDASAADHWRDPR